MGRSKKSKLDTPENQALLAAKPEVQRDRDMFQDWLIGNMNHAQIAHKYGLVPTTVSTIASRQKWGDLKRKFKERLFQDLLDDTKDDIVFMAGMLRKDVKRLEENVQNRKRGGKLMTKDERQFVLKYMEVLLNEEKLRSGKPTTISSGEIVTKFVLPEGVEDAFVIPPDPSIKIERERLDKDQITDAEFEEILATRKNQ